MILYRKIRLVVFSPVWHPEVHGVRPEWRVRQGCGDRRIVQESLFFHHGELVVAAHPQIWWPQTDHAVISQICVLLGDYAHTSHFFGPVLDGRVAPKLLVVVVPATIGNEKKTPSGKYLQLYLSVMFEHLSFRENNQEGRQPYTFVGSFYGKRPIIMLIGQCLGC